MDKSEIMMKAKKLHPKIQEYIKYGIELGFFYTDNIEDVIGRLENVQFGVDNTIPGDAQTIPLRDGSGRIIIKQNEKRMYAQDKKPYFADEVLFHEFTHATNGIYKSWFQSLDSWDMKKKIQIFMTESEKAEFDIYGNRAEFRQAGYGWGLLDDYISQYVAQSMVEAKYKRENIYPEKFEMYQACRPQMGYKSNLADYPIYTPFAQKFVEALTGKQNIKEFCVDAFKPGIVDTIIDKFSKRKNGLENLYKILGYMGNIDFAENARLGHFGPETLKQDSDNSARNPEKLYQSMAQVNKLLDFEIERAKIGVGFGGTSGANHRER